MTDVKGYHPVVEDARVALGHKFQLAATSFDHREVVQMSADKIPSAFLRLAALGETVFQTAIGLVGGNDEVLFHGGGTRDRSKASLLLVERGHMGDHEAGILQRGLNRVPD